MSVVNNVKKVCVEAIGAGLTLISPRLNAKAFYFLKTRKKLDLNNPKDFKEKLLKLKLEQYDKSPIVRQCADKFTVRQYVNQKLAEAGVTFNILNELIATYSDPDDINWDELPDKFAMKWNFGCGFNIIVPNKSELNIHQATRKLKKWKRTVYYLPYAEMQYKDVHKVILVEKFLEGKQGGLPEDFKLYCFNGHVKAVLYISEREKEQHRAAFFDTQWNYIGQTNKDSYAAFEIPPMRPGSLETMIKVAEILSEPFPFVRIDFFDVDGKAIFGEMTFTPAGAVNVSETMINGKTMGDILEV